MNYNLTPKEYEIMKFIWAHAQDGVTFGEIHQYVNSLEKTESRQRVNCFIQSLLNKKVLTSAGEDRHKIYTPAVSKESFDETLANKLLNQLFDGSLKNFISALSGGQRLSDENAKELRKILRERNKL